MIVGKIVALHSYKGGTGKTLLSINLAMIYANQGKKVCLIDMDFGSPSLCYAFKTNEVEHWVNDYLNDVCDIKSVLIDLTQKYVGKGKFLVGFANPSTEAIRDIVSKDRKWEMRALGRLLSLKQSLLGKMGFDYVIFDTSSGVQYSSINSVVSADLVLIIMSTDPSDVKGTWRMTHELHDLFEKKTLLILNKVLVSSTTQRKIARRLKSTHNPPVLDMIPCLCDVLEAGGTHIFTTQPDHPLIRKLEIIATKIELS